MTFFSARDVKIKNKQILDPGDQGSIPGWVIPKDSKNGTWCRLT